MRNAASLQPRVLGFSLLRDGLSASPAFQSLRNSTYAALATISAWRIGVMDDRARREM